MSTGSGWTPVRSHHGKACNELNYKEPRAGRGTGNEQRLPALNQRERELAKVGDGRNGALFNQDR